MKHHLVEFDNQFRQTGFINLCGIDEVGRGPLAGPVVAAALVLKEGVELTGINDSKKISEKMRNKLDTLVKESALTYGIGCIDSNEIDRINILQATFKAMRLAVNALSIPPDYLMIDGRDFPKFNFRDSIHRIVGKNIIKGDQQSQSIAGASILAKVYRDRLMRDYDKIYPQYGFAKHKGYATRAHRENILQFGPCDIHRKSFLSNLLRSKQKLIL